MSELINLSIISHNGKLFNEDVEFFKCFSKTGEVGIYPGHTNSVILLESTDLEYEKNSKITKVFVKQGVLSIKSSKATIITDQLLFSDDIDVNSVKSEIDQLSKSQDTEDSLVNETNRKLELEAKAKLRVTQA